MKNIFDLFQLYPEVFKFLPVNKELPKLPKQWIVNVGYTIIGDDFGHWIKEQILERNKKVTTQKNLLIDMDPEVAAAFQQSTNVSCK